MRRKNKHKRLWAVRKAKAELEKKVNESEKPIRNNVKKATVFKISSVLVSNKKFNLG